MRSGTGRWTAVVVAAVLVTGMLAGCGGKEQTETRPLVIVGVDSADWHLWRPMLDEGRLPHLAAFMDQAASGRMKTFYPLEKSPLLWASITTGTTPDVHGVAHFVKGADQKPVRGAAWGAPALWDILGAAGLSTSIVGMWTTYPARPIEGVMVSDYLPYGRSRNKPLENLVYPDSLTEQVVSLRVDPDTISNEQLTRFIDADKMELAESKYGGLLSDLREIWAADLGYLAVHRWLAQETDFDLTFIYLRGPDMVSHKFYAYMVPDKTTQYMQEDEIEIFREIVPRYYEWCDEVLGEILGWFPPDRQVMVVSDHGFHGPRPQGKGTIEHSEWGVCLVRSPLYEAGTEFDYLELLDLCPTILALIGLPPGADMPGSVLAEALTADGETFVRRLEGNRFPSYMPLRPTEGPGGEQDAGVDEELRKQLRSLGYID
ncbi:MAG: hypothetical protein GY838_16245 [bacterium]|nr:hypothetical protein [bacterium]